MSLMAQLNTHNAHKKLTSLFHMRIMRISTDGKEAMGSKEILKKLQSDGWEIVRTRGSHHQLRHPEKSGTVTVPHPKRELPTGTVRSIERQSGVKLL